MAKQFYFLLRFERPSFGLAIYKLVNSSFLSGVSSQKLMVIQTFLKVFFLPLHDADMSSKDQPAPSKAAAAARARRDAEAPQQREVRLLANGFSDHFGNCVKCRRRDAPHIAKKNASKGSIFLVVKYS